MLLHSSLPFGHQLCHGHDGNCKYCCKKYCLILLTQVCPPFLIETDLYKKLFWESRCRVYELVSPLDPPRGKKRKNAQKRTRKFHFASADAFFLPTRRKDMQDRNYPQLGSLRGCCNGETRFLFRGGEGAKIAAILMHPEGCRRRKKGPSLR